MKDVSSLKNLIHYPVMLDQVVELCSPEKGGDFIDCTFGCGGHTNAILSFPETRVISLDRDSHVLSYVSETKKNIKSDSLFIIRNLAI